MGGLKFDGEQARISREEEEIRGFLLMKTGQS
jgi:hypothetical protein